MPNATLKSDDDSQTANWKSERRDETRRGWDKRRSLIKTNPKFSFLLSYYDSYADHNIYVSQDSILSVQLCSLSPRKRKKKKKPHTHTQRRYLIVGGTFPPLVFSVTWIHTIEVNKKKKKKKKNARVYDSISTCFMCNMHKSTGLSNVHVVTDVSGCAK